MFEERAVGEVHFKVAYWGPAHAGKSTNLRILHARSKPDERGPMRAQHVAPSAGGDAGSVLFFELTAPALGRIRGLRPRFHLFAASGAAAAREARAFVLDRADAIVFVADTTIDALEATVSAAKELRDHLFRTRGNGARMPIVVQYNKRDISELDLETVRFHLGFSAPLEIEAVAATGEGVIDTLRLAVRAILEPLRLPRPEQAVSSEAK